MRIKKRTINIPILKGQPTDGSGIICIHLLVRDPNGPFTENKVYHQAPNQESNTRRKKLIRKPTKCRIACDPKKLVVPIIKNGVTFLTFRSEDPRATTCTKCKKSKDFEIAMNLLNKKKNITNQETK